MSEAIKEVDAGLLARQLRDDFPAVDVTTVVFSADFSGVGCCVIPQEKVLEIIKALEARAPSPEGGVRERLAALLLARDESEYHKPIPTSLIEWGAVCIANGKNAKHSGDCTNESHTCGRCLTDMTLQQADQILAALRTSPPPIAGREEIATGAKFNDPNCCMGTKDENDCPCMSISPSAPMVIIAGIRQFGLAPDGSDLRDLESAILRLTPSPSAEPVAWRGGAKWFLASQNDGLFIINAEPRPSNDYPWHDRPNGPTIVLNVTELPEAKAIKIVSVLNAPSPTTVSDASREALEECRNAIRAVYHEIDNPSMPACLAAAWEVADAALSRPSDTTSAAGKSGGGA